MKTFIFIVSFLCIAPQAFGATVVFDAESGPLRQNQEFLVSVYLNTEGELINGIAGTISFSNDILKIKELRRGNSSVAIWINEPRAESEITFAGITPGGLIGPKLFLFSLVFEGKDAGTAFVVSDALEAFRNDGIGSATAVKKSRFEAVILSAPNAAPSSLAVAADTNPPDDFTPSLGIDGSIFNGEYFLAFITQDKESGISHYEIREEDGPFAVAVSPYHLHNQKLDKKISVKAIDKSDNEKIVIFYPPRWQPWYQQYRIFIVMLVGALFAILYRYRRLFFGML